MVSNYSRSSSSWVRINCKNTKLKCLPLSLLWLWSSSYPVESVFPHGNGRSWHSKYWWPCPIWRSLDCPRPSLRLQSHLRPPPEFFSWNLRPKKRSFWLTRPWQWCWSGSLSIRLAWFWLLDDHCLWFPNKKALEPLPARFLVSYFSTHSSLFFFREVYLKHGNHDVETLCRLLT